MILTLKIISQNKYIVVIYEGRKRQIRRMFEELGYEVSNLHRIRIGGLDLKELNLGFKEYAFVTKKFLEDKARKKIEDEIEDEKDIDEEQEDDLDEKDMDEIIVNKSIA